MSSIVLYDLVGADDRRFSSHCWRIRPALAHKGLSFETVPTPFTAMGTIGDGSFPTLPVIRDGETWVCDSWAIAEYLEATYPDRPSLFGGEAGHALTAFVAQWWRTRLHLFVMPMILQDIHDHLVPEDRDWFAETRAKRFGKTIEELKEGREERRVEMRERLGPLRQLLADQPFLGGRGAALCRLSGDGHLYLGPQDESLRTGRTRRPGPRLDEPLSGSLRWCRAAGSGFRLVAYRLPVPFELS